MDLSKREPLQVEYVDISTIKPYEKNAKTHDAEQVKKIESSIKRFGWRKPIVVDKDGVIVCGHGAYFAAKELKLESVPVAYARDLTEKEIKAYRLADNKVAESPWDFNLLNLELTELDDFEMGDFGFEVVEAGDGSEYGTDFTLPEGDKSEYSKMTFIFHEKQKELIDAAIGSIEDPKETFGNTQKNGNALYAVVKEWEELKRLS